MAIYIPVDPSIRKAIVHLRNPHNHPMYPKSKPSTDEKDQLKKAINAAGKRGLTVRKLINGINIMILRFDINHIDINHLEFQHLRHLLFTTTCPYQSHPLHLWIAVN
jgi:hypothetical protein